MKIKDEKYHRLFQCIAYTVVLLITAACLFPFLLIISASLTDNETILTQGYHLIPPAFSLEGYRMVFQFPDEVLRAYGVTGLTTVVGTLGGLFFITMAGYVLQRKSFKYRNQFAFFIYFTTLFGGGLVPWYIMYTKYLNLMDTYAVLIIPGLMSPFLIILMKNFIKSAVPEEIFESAQIDGANEFTIYARIVLQLSLPGLATIGLFLALHYWNDWFSSSMFINNPHMYQLQYYLYNVINTISFVTQMGASSGVSLGQDIPTESTKMAMAIIVTGPILLLYPFVQRYFVKGLTIGAVKG
ncbi:sugar ABC transporter permease [Paenibacillus selenitireducens]|jgi:putative aldouronate transport system permease protein|uniref:Sugar ABC transporter permease n=1 Tax=Paenibacillus selenitireducens TaxID=1324314 RepID=A0A1T2X916_9BACL|nr:carbohydrate ABC transporter permease [Paenibacillus selenitireducens]OPA76332.1 sugar ABC transporter permease [Paenibacillus selenitireducens]